MLNEKMYSANGPLLSKFLNIVKNIDLPRLRDCDSYAIIDEKKLTAIIEQLSTAGKFHQTQLHDELVKSRISDGFVKSSRSRLANSEE